MPGPYKNLTHFLCCANITADTLYEESRGFLVAVYSSVCILALPANGLTAWLALRQAWRGNVLAVYLFSLALCELLYAGTLPLWARYIQNHHHWPLGRWACQLTAFVFFCNIYASILLLCCISGDRFLALVWPLQSRPYRRPATAALVSTAVFVLVGLIHSPVFYIDFGSCNVTCFESLPVTSITAPVYYSRFVLGFALPMGVLVSTNLCLFRRVQRSPTLSAACKARVCRLVWAVLLIFLACFAPYHLVLLFRAATFSYLGEQRKALLCALEQRVYTASVVGLGLCTVSSVADPIIYLLATDFWRQEVARLHWQWDKWGRRTDITAMFSKDGEEPRSPASPRSPSMP